MEYIRKIISNISFEDKTIDLKTPNINESREDIIKNYELNNAFFLHTDKNTALTNIVSKDIRTIKIVNIISKQIIRGIININYNFLKFNFVIINKKYSSIEELYLSITNKQDYNSMIDNFNNHNYFVNVIITEIDNNNNLLCKII